MTAKTKIVLTCAGVLLLVACITINVYFPEAAVKELSQQIEDEIEKQAADATTPEAQPTPSPSTTSEAGDGLVSMLLSVGASTAWAEEVPSPGISNPAIRKIIESRATRLDAINELKARGVLGESNRALLEIRSLDILTDLKERAAAQRLVREENADREQLFKEIAAAENVELSQLDRIRQTYAETMRDKARPGDWIQLPDGTWQQKGS
jgi:uncharacterized protein YdbL (DUF1318 family)